MAEDLDQNLDQTKERLSSSKLSDADVQLVMDRLTPVYKDSSIAIGGNVSDSVLIPGDHNQVTINKGTDAGELLDKINRITAENQGANRKDLLDKINLIIDEAEAAQQRPIRCKTRSMLLTGVGIGVLIGIVRFLAGLQGLELWALDGLMSAQQPFAQKDNRILVIAPDDEEVDKQGQAARDKGVSMTDETLADVLTKVQKVYRPTVIGLDLQRDFGAKPELAQLLNPSFAPKHTSPPLPQQTKGAVKKGRIQSKKATAKYKQGSETIPHPPLVKAATKLDILNVVGGCKAMETDEENKIIKGSEVAPPPEIDKEKIGFTDFITGVGGRGVSRRQILAHDPPVGSKICTTKLAFSTQIASQFLLKEGFNKPEPKPLEESCLRFSKSNSSSFSFPLLNPFMGGFQGGRDWSSGCQMILNYGTKKITIIRLKDLDEAAKDQSSSPVDQANLPEIVLIGSGARKQKDMWLTPLGEIEGVIVQALATSQIIDVVLGKQRLIWALPDWTDFLWTLGWALLGGVFGWRLPFWKAWLVSLFTAVTVLCLICSLSFWFWQLWLPLIPALIALPVSASSVAYLNFRLKFGTSNPFQILRAALIESK